MNHDVAIIGGAFSGAATALMLKRRCPEARVLIIEKAAEFDRKVGESTTEVSSAYMTRILGLTHHLGHQHLPKQGLRLWLARDAEQSPADCVELGARYGARLPGFQVDRATLDSHLLDQAVAAGCDLLRPAKVTALELNEGGEQKVTVQTSNETQTISVRWVVDATGRAAMISRKLGYFRQNTAHPINAVWARFTGTRQWDSYDWREQFPEMANACRTGREWATNHLMGFGWWCWIIPLRGGDVSAGVVYDERIFQLPPGPNLGARLHAHLLAHPIGRAIFAKARPIEGDVHAFSALPYSSDRVCGDGWALVGDAAGFLDPLYSPGLDFCSFTSYFVAAMLARSIRGEEVRALIEYYNEQYQVTYRSWFDSLYRDKYFYMGEGDLMAASLLLDVSSYYIGVVRNVYRNAESAFERLPFEGRPGRVAATFMKFYRERLVKIARRRAAAGQLSRINHGWRELYDGFVPDFRLRKQFTQGLLRWWRAELGNLFLRRRQPEPSPGRVTAQPAEL
ncbi:MAG: NAD(P)/FAD-dependent oxidoreductase [Verrucomicrobia bacterium]|nr:NAD(P)/FAD-dependent oxidoreductase [Verrucomicrobiota bacterium]